MTLNGSTIQLHAINYTIDCQLIVGPVLCSLFHQNFHNTDEVSVLNEEGQNSTLPSNLAPLLKEFEDVFAEPVGLPPTSGGTHHSTSSMDHS